MAYTESDRVQIRNYLGFASLYLQADPRLESAITASQATSDTGGTRPDNSTELFAKALVVKLQAIDTALDDMTGTFGATKVDEISVDTARETARLRMHGRMYVHRLARIFDTFPHSDIFSSAPPDVYPGYPRTANRVGY